VSVYRRGKTWWYSFIFCGQYIQESAKTKSKTVAKEAEKNRRRELEEGYNNITPQDRNRRVFTVVKAAEEYQEQYKARYSENAAQYSAYCIKHLTEHLGNKMLIEVTDHTVIAYQDSRLKEEAAGKTINEEVGTLFRIMGEIGETVRLKLKRKKKLKLTEREDVGKAMTVEQEKELLVQTKASKSPYIHTAVVIALNTGLRYTEIRLLQWKQIDFFKQMLTVGKSKTAEGTGRTVPLNSELLRLLAAHQCWYEKNAGKATGDNYVFPSKLERIVIMDEKTKRRFDPEKPASNFNKAWNAVRGKAKVSVRFHDLRHTLITKLAESGAGDETIMGIAGHVSRRMLSRYAHIRTEAKRKALESIVAPEIPAVAVEANDQTPVQVMVN
jgi:integrase